MPSCHDSVADDEDRANRGIGAGLPERLLCFGERGAHELFVSLAVHLFETSIGALDRRGNECSPTTTQTNMSRQPRRRVGYDERRSSTAPESIGVTTIFLLMITG
jgi:hypothetical protein